MPPLWAELNGHVINNIREGGAIIGEISFLLESPRTATVRAIERSELPVVKDIESLLETNPMLMARVAKRLAVRVRELDEAIPAPMSLCSPPGFIPP